jgi:hypothetical protein
MTAPFALNLSINTSTNFSQTFSLTDDEGGALDLSLYTYDSQIRKHPNSSTAVSFATTAPTPSTGDLIISLGPSDTADLKPGRYVYDIVLTKISDSTKTRVLQGSVIVSKTITR